MNKYNNPNNSDKPVQTNNTCKREREIRHNWQITNRYCRVILEGSAPRVMPTQTAIEYAQGLGLDLVEVGYDKASACSICKLYDYSKFIYEQKKREKQAKKQARENRTDVKEVQLSLTIDVADEKRFALRAREFLESGDKVKIALRFRNRRELNNISLAKDVISRFLSNFNDIAVLDSAPQISGREMSCVIRPVKK